jgi:hypothetical protein
MLRQIRNNLPLLLLSVGMAACAKPHLSTRVDVAAWRQVTTPHFVLRTDFDEKTAIAVAKSLEATRDTLVSASWPTANFGETERLHAIALANKDDFKSAFGSVIAGVFSSRPIPTFIISGDPEKWETGMYRWGGPTSILRHEMAHQLSAAVMPDQPHWFAEGLAQFLETVHPSDDGASVVVGEFNAHAFESYERAWRVP